MEARFAVLVRKEISCRAIFRDEPINSSPARSFDTAEYSCAQDDTKKRHDLGLVFLPSRCVSCPGSTFLIARTVKEDWHVARLIRQNRRSAVLDYRFFVHPD
jgi:hypothetical protein